MEKLASDLATPVPVRLTVCGLEIALSVMVRTPVRVPAAIGEKVTEIVHCEFVARMGGQLFVWAKSPVIVMLATFNGAPPEFVSVTVAAPLVVPTFCAARDKLAGVTEACGSPIPMPCRDTYCDPPAALSLIARTPAASPMTVGEKSTLNVQLAPGTRLEGQPLVTEKLPLTVTSEIWRGAPLGLLTVTTAGMLVVPTPCSPKESPAG